VVAAAKAGAAASGCASEVTEKKVGIGKDVRKKRACVLTDGPRVFGKQPRRRPVPGKSGAWSAPQGGGFEPGAAQAGRPLGLISSINASLHALIDEYRKVIII